VLLPSMHGRGGFIALWTAQMASVLGSEMTRFALPVWLYQTGQGSVAVSTAALAAQLPRILCGIFAGAVVDRGHRKRIFLACDLALAGVTAALCQATESTGSLGLVYMLLFLHGALATVQFPCLIALTPGLVSAARLRRANALLGLADSLAQFAGPLLGAGLLSRFSLHTILLADLGSFLLSFVLVGWIRVVDARPSERHGFSEILRMTAEGFRHIRQQQALSRLLVLNTSTNFLFSLSFVLFTPLVLRLSGNDSGALALILAAGGVAQIGGSLLATTMSTGGSGVRAELAGTVAMGLFGPLLIGLTGDLKMVTLGYVMTMLILPCLQTCNRTAWQLVVPAELHGRIFSTKRLISSSCAPIGMAIAGPLADGLLEPRLGGPSAGGYRLLFVFCGLIIAGLAAIALTRPWIQTLDEESNPRLRREEECHP
jgi:DHA3 family macrolide efflux protein-like MFS transporter